MLGLEDLFAEAGDDVHSSGSGSRNQKSDINSPPLPRPPCGLCGISNQGATCYLNSLLQTLNFTPEFREALFELGEEELGNLYDKDKPGSRVRVIPIQLQKLLAHLRLSDQQSVSTVELTESFGWTNNEELQQHDVQELNRILFSAIEDSLVATSGGDLIQRLYHGTIVNQITCTECRKVSEREEDFLDLCISVAGNACLENGLYNTYCETERMDGKNQYRCERCGKLVDAVKGTKLRNLPEILTISLLRFSFDFQKMQRFKETGNFVFPTELNMAPYCEQVLGPDEYMYELFSVVIHRGGAHGGHYYAYIRDVDDVGTWTHPEEEVIQIAADPSTGEVDFIECDSPVDLVQAILYRSPEKSLSVDKLAAEISKQTGVSWNKRFKRHYGPITKFLAKYDDVFLFDSAAHQVYLKQYGPTSKQASVSSSTDVPGEEKTEKNKRPISPRPSPGHCWFNFDDRRIHPITEKEIQKTFSGKSSAYMLFYRKSNLIRPPEATADPAYKIPDRYISQVLQENDQLQQEREEHELAVNRITIRALFHTWFQYKEGALHPQDYESSYREITIDRRKTVLDLKIAILELGDGLVSGEFVIHRIKELPAGFHLYDELSIEDDKFLMDMYLTDGDQIFIWNGETVDEMCVPVGVLSEPVLLNISYNEGRHIISGFAKNLTLAQFGSFICDRCGVALSDIVIKRVTEKGDLKLIPFTRDQFDDTLAALKLKDGDEIVIENIDTSGTSKGPKAVTCGRSKVYVQVQNRCSQAVEGKNTCRLEIERTEFVSVLKALALSKLRVGDIREGGRLRINHDIFGLKAPLHEQQTVDDAGISNGTLLVLEGGPSPMSNEISLFISLADPQCDTPSLELMIDRSVTVSACLNCVLHRLGHHDDNWHLRKTNWFGEAAEVLDDQDAKLENSLVNDGDNLLLERGRIPPKGFIRPQIWLYPSPQRPNDSSSGVLSWISSGIHNLLGNTTLGNGEPVNIGEVEISLQTPLEELKLQILTLPQASQLNIPMLSFLRVRMVENNMLGAVLKDPSQTLQKLNLKACTNLAIQVLQQEENLSMNHIVLSVCQRIPGTKTYGPAPEVIWDTSQGAYIQSIKQAIADALFLQMEDIAIAKHFPTKYEWLVIKEQTKKNNQKNKKKGKQKSNLRQAPFHIHDGDTIGVKNLQYDPLKIDDFATAEDELGLAEVKRQAEEKKREREERKKLQGDFVFEDEKKRRPEVALTIKVEDFR